MDKLIPIVVILTVLVGVSHAAHCDLTYGGYTYCSRGCCGVYTITCCGSNLYISSSVSTAVIIAFVVGSIVGLCVLIGIIICCVKACCSGTRGTVIQQPQNQPHVMLMSTAQQSNRPMGQQPYPGQPQPYAVQAPYPAQVGYTDTAYPPAQQGNASTTYPPPFAGNPPPYGFNTDTSPKANPGDNPPPAYSVSQ